MPLPTPGGHIKMGSVGDGCVVLIESLLVGMLALGDLYPYKDLFAFALALHSAYLLIS